MARGITACKQYCLAAGATQGNIAYTQTVRLSNNPSFSTIQLLANFSEEMAVFSLKIAI